MRQLTLWQYESFLIAEEKHRPTEEETRKAYVYGKKSRRGRPSIQADEEEFRRCYNKQREYRRYRSFDRYLNELERQKTKQKRRPEIERLPKESDYLGEEERFWHRRLQTVQKRCYNRGLPCDLTPEYLVELREKQRVCPYFGTPLLADRGTEIDRIKPDLGYTKGNVQLLSALANRMKSNATPEQLEQFARAVLGIESNNS